MVQTVWHLSRLPLLFRDVKLYQFVCILVNDYISVCYAIVFYKWCSKIRVSAVFTALVNHAFVVEMVAEWWCLNEDQLQGFCCKYLITNLNVRLLRLYARKSNS